MRGTASKRPALKLGGDKEKFRSLAFFQKLRLVRRSLTALNRRSPTKNPGAKAARVRKGDRLALRPFYANNKRTSKPKLGCPFFIPVIRPGHCLQAAPGMTMSLVFYGCAARARSWSSAPHLASLLKKACAKTLLVSTQLARRAPPLRNARRRLAWGATPATIPPPAASPTGRWRPRTPLG